MARVILAHAKYDCGLAALGWGVSGSLWKGLKGAEEVLAGPGREALEGP